MVEDLKEVIEIPSSNGQEEKIEEPAKEEVKEATAVETPTQEVETEENIETLPDWAKARLAKLENDKENYKKGLLKYKKLTLTPEKEVVKEEGEEYPEWDETSKKFQKQTLDEAEKIAERKAQAIIEQANEKAAIAKFLAKNPAVQEHWDDIVSNYSPKNGKETISAVLKDLDRAYLLTRYEMGELDKLQQEASKKGEKAGVAKAKLAELSSVSKTTSKTVPEGKALSEGAIAMANQMRVDPKKLAQEDDSLTAEIKF